MSGTQHQQASGSLPLFLLQAAHKALWDWGLGEETPPGTASVELSRSRLIGNHSQHIKA